MEPSCSRLENLRVRVVTQKQHSTLALLAVQRGLPRGTHCRLSNKEIDYMKKRFEAKLQIKPCAANETQKNTKRHRDYTHLKRRHLHLEDVRIGLEG